MRFMSEGLPRLTPLPCVLTGSSNHNKRIECFWGLLCQQRIQSWISYFKDLQGEGQIIAWDNIDRKVSYYVFQELVLADLEFMKGMHNDHLIRQQPGDIISGKPWALYLDPEQYGPVWRTFPGDTW